MFRRLNLLYALLVFCVCFSLPLRAEVEWTPDLESLEGRLAFLQTMLERHPNLITSNLQFRRNLMEVLRKIPPLRKKLAENGTDPKIAKISRLSHEFVAGGEWNYDPSKIDALKTELTKAVDALPIKQFKSFADDLRTLKIVASGNEPKFVEHLNSWFKLMPYLYDSEGKPIYPALDTHSLEALKSRIESASPSEMKNSYGDLLKEHLEGYLQAATKEKGLGAITAHYRTFRGTFIDAKDSQLRSALTPIPTSGGQIETRALTLEELPAYAGIFRGCFGGDCSISTIPFYPLVKGVKVYAIRKGKSFSGQPAGYIIAVPGTVEGKSLPYIVTVNGAGLNPSDVKASVRMVMRDWNASQVVVTDFSKNKNVVNTDEMRDGLIYPNAKAVEVTMPNGWDEIDKVSHGYYKADNLKHGYLVELAEAKENFQIKRESVAAPYRPQNKPETLSLLSRSVLAAQGLYETTDATEQNEIKTILKVTDQQVSTALPLISANSHSPLTATQFEGLKNEFQYTLADVIKLDVLTSAHSIGNLHKEKPDLVDSSTWQSTTTKSFEKLTRAMNEAAGHPEAIVAALEAQLALPVPFRPSDEAILESQFKKLQSTDPSEKAAGIGALTHFRKRLSPESLATIEHFLHDASPLVQTAAIDFFKKDPTATPRVVNEVEKLTAHADPAIRAKAFGALTQWLKEDPRLEKIGIPLLKDPAEEVRAGALRYFVERKVHNQELIALIAPNLSVSDSNLRQKVGTLIADANVSDPRIQKDVEQLLTDPNPEVRATAIKIIPKFVIATDAFKWRVVEMLSDPNAAVRIQALTTLKELDLLSKSRRVRSLVIPLFADPEQSVRNYTKSSLSMYYFTNPELIDELIALYRGNKDPKIRLDMREAAFDESSWQDKSKIALDEKLGNLLSDPDPEMRDLGLGLFASGPREAGAAAIAKLAALTGDADLAVRLNALKALARSAPIPRKFHLQIASGLDSAELEIRLQTLKTLEHLANHNQYTTVKTNRGTERLSIPLDSGLYPLITELLSDPDSQIREKAGNLLERYSEFKGGDAAGIADLVEIKKSEMVSKPLTPFMPEADIAQLNNLKSKDWETYKPAETFFRAKKSESNAYLLKLIDLVLEDPSEAIHDHVYNAVTHLFSGSKVNHPVIHERVAKLLSSKNERGCLLGLDLLPKLIDASDEIKARVLPLLQDPSEKVRRQAIHTTYTLGLSKIEAVRSAFIQMTADPDHEVRRAAGGHIYWQSVATPNDYQFLLNAYRHSTDEKLLSYLKEHVFNQQWDTEIDSLVGHLLAVELAGEDRKMSGLALEIFSKRTSLVPAESLKPLTEILKQGGVQEQTLALQALAGAKAIPTNVHTAIAHGLTHPSAEIRKQTLVALEHLTSYTQKMPAPGRRDKDTTIPIPLDTSLYSLVVDQLAEEDAQIREKAEWALKKFAEFQPHDAGRIARLKATKVQELASRNLVAHIPPEDWTHLENLNSREFSLSHAAGDYFRKMKGRSDEFNLKLLEIAADLHEKSDNRSSQMQTIIRASESAHPQVHLAAAKLLDNPHPWVRRFALNIFTSFSDVAPEVKERVFARIHDTDTENRRHAISTLRELGLMEDLHHQNQVLPFLLDPDDRVRQNTRSATYSPILLDASQYDEILKLYRQTTDPKIKDELKTNYLVGGAWDEKVQEGIDKKTVGLLKDKDAEIVQLVLSRIAQRSKARTPLVVEKLMALLQRPESEVRIKTLKVLQNEQAIEEHHQLPIASLLNDRDVAVRREALALIKSTTHSNHQTREVHNQQGYTDHVNIPLDPRWPELIAELLSDDDGKIRAAAAETLEGFTKLEPELHSHIQELIEAKRIRMRDGDLSVNIPMGMFREVSATTPISHSALLTLFRIGPKAINERLDEVLAYIADPDPKIRAKVLSIARQRKLNSQSLAVIAEAIAAHPENGRDGESLFKKRGAVSERAVIALIQYAAVTDRSWDLQETIKKSGPLSATAIKTIRALAEAGHDGVERILRDDAIPKDLEAQKALIEAMTSRNRNISSSAWRMLQKSQPAGEELSAHASKYYDRMTHHWEAQELGKLLRVTHTQSIDWKPLLPRIAKGDGEAYHRLVSSLDERPINDPAYEKAVVELFHSKDPSAVGMGFALVSKLKLSTESVAELEKVYFNPKTTVSARTYVAWSLCGHEGSALRVCEAAKKDLSKIHGLEIIPIVTMLMQREPHLAPELQKMLIRALHDPTPGASYSAVNILESMHITDPDVQQAIRDAAANHPESAIKTRCREILRKLSTKRN